MSLEQTIGNLDIRYANTITFVGTSNTMVDTTTGRIQTKGFQHNSNVITDISGPHGRVAPTLKKYPEIVFAEGTFDSNDTTNVYIQAGYTVSVSGFVNSTNRPWKAFNGIDSETGLVLSGINYDTSGNANTTGTTASRLSASSSTPYGEWLKIKLPNKIKLNKYTFTSRNDAALWTQSVETGQIWGSNDDSTWVQLHTFANSGFTGASQSANFNVTTSEYYKYYAFIVTKTFSAGTDYHLCIPELKYYGYEEDPPVGDHSVDTTFKSRFNNPQLTGVQVLVDGATGLGTNQISGGPDPSGNQSTMSSPNKYWTLNGTLTSNLSVEANTFLEGDQPHAVSVWFNSSNLETNVSNTCVFSISDQEKLDSDNLTLQSNTWHNLTYTYQGEGGSKVTYLDGVKVVEGATDTFGEYPPSAMTGYSQGGYVVSASGEDVSSPAWKIFDDSTTTSWDAGAASFQTGQPGLAETSGANPGEEIILADGTTHTRGHWLQLQFPFKFIVSRYTQSSSTATPDTNPVTVSLLGSNDTTNWYIIKDVHQDPALDVSHVDVNATRAYKYIRYVVHAIGGPNTRLLIQQLQYYGHRENDIIRLPDPTNVLKYPHIAMTGSVQRGYVVTSSGGVVTTPDKAFDGKYVSTDGNWLSTAGTFSSGVAQSVETFNGSGSVVNGPWLKVEMKNKIVPTKLNMFVRESSITNPRQPRAGILYGSVDDSSWTNLGSFSYADTTLTGNSTPNEITLTPSPTGTHYKYFILHVTQMMTSKGASDRVSITGMEFIGTEEATSVPIRIGGGNIDKVANFRVYDKFIQEGQALEIWNAEKDYFGRAKSSMTLQQGKLGIGTVTPGYTLDVAGDINLSGTFNQNGAPFASSPWTTTGVDLSYTTGNVSVGKDLTVTGNVQLQGGIALGAHIIPTTNAAFDIGSASYKIRDMYVDDNSLWIGDRAKISFSGGKMKFKRRKLNKIPKVVKDLAIAHSVPGVTDEATAGEDAVTYLKAHFPSDGIGTLADLKLQHWKAYTKSIDATKEISDIFVDNDEDYEAVAAAEAWSEVGSNIFSTYNVTIGDTTEPRAELDVVGTGAIIVPSGTTDQRPATGINGMLRYNSTTGYMEAYTASGWGSIATPPSIQTISPASVAVADVTTQVFTVGGAFFDAQTTIQLQGSDSTKYDVTDFVFTNSGSIGFKMGTLASGQAANRPYNVVVTNGAGLSVPSAATIGFTPIWTSPAAGATLSTFDTTASVTNTELAATDDVGGSGVTYSVPAANLPSGLTLNPTTGAITGTIGAAGTTSVTFRVTDNVSGALAERTFSIVGVAPLYTFTTHTFTNVGRYGRTGPTLSELHNSSSGYGTTGTTTWVGNSSHFGVTTTGIQKWTVPKTGSYTIAAYGSGSRAVNDGGYGARITGTCTLTKGEIIYILVGQTSINATNSSNHGGGGGTFVVRTPYNNNSSIIVIAGGGGGAHGYGTRVTGNASLTTTGNTGHLNVAGGTNGGAGTSGASNNQGAGFVGGSPGLASSFTSGGLGGSHGGGDGGFGGGGRHGNSHGGGGGGYSGGGGGKANPYVGGGGGSYKATFFTVTSEDNTVHDGPGSVTITQL
jgi:hypothetical protein